jgi:Ca2+-binding EF-hand superfamily protein
MSPKRDLATEIHHRAQQRGCVFSPQDKSKDFHQAMHKFHEGSATDRPSVAGQLSEKERDTLRKRATVVNMSADDVFHCKTVFDGHDQHQTGTVGEDDFENVVTQLLESQLRDKMIPQSEVRKLCQEYWVYADDSGDIVFDDFIRWYSNTLRSKNFVTENEWRLQIASEHDMTLDAVDFLKQCFDAYNKGGHLDLNAFKHVVEKALRIPRHQELPPPRVEQFFNACARTPGGRIGFDEFLTWWARYFHGSTAVDEQDANVLDAGKQRLPFEDYYRRLRPSTGMILDPPCYVGGVPLSVFLKADSDIVETRRCSIGSERKKLFKSAGTKSSDSCSRNSSKEGTLTGLPCLEEISSQPHDASWCR